MYKIVIELDNTELRIKPGNDIWMPMKISGWNFEEEDLELQLEDKIRKFILEFIKEYRRETPP